MTGKSFKKKKTWVIFWCWGWTNERTLVKDMYHTVSGFCAHWVLRSKTGDDCDYNVSLGRILRSSSWSFLRALHASTGRRGHRCTSQVFWSQFHLAKVRTESDRMPKRTPSSTELHVLRLCLTTYIAQRGSYSLAAMALYFGPTKYAGELEHGDVCERASYAKISDN